jgi:hypothetical protein
MAVAIAATLAPGVFAAPVGQGLGGAGTVQGTVKDPTGAGMAGVEVAIANTVSGFKATAVTDAAGKFAFRNLPPNPYRMTIATQGYKPYTTDVDIRSSVPIELPLITLALAIASETATVVGHPMDLVELDPTAHTDVDQSLIRKLPIEAGGGLNQVVMMAAPGVVADSNSFFHPIGDHAQTQFSIDNQPVTDQQSRIYSNQISADAVQAMEVITGVAPAEYGDKSSLVVHIVTKSGLDQATPTGSVSLGYGSFKAPAFEANIGAGSHTVGNFLSVSGTRTDRFLDSPELTALHDHGSSQSFFDRLDVHQDGGGTLHLNTTVGRSSFDVPTTLDALDQAQHQKIDSVNVAPGYARVLGTKALLTLNGFVRRDKVGYLPSANPFADTPATVSQNRSLTNLGAKVDLAYTAGAHNFKVGGSISATRLTEHFTIGFTDPAFNSPCVDAGGSPVGDPTLLMVSQCHGALSANMGFDPALLAYDLSRHGAAFVSDAKGTIKEQAFYAEDDVKAGNASFKLGLRVDRYDGLVLQSLVQPRLGISYAFPASGTVLRASFGRTQETPYNENLLLSSGFGSSGALVGTSDPLKPGRRKQGEIGVQQGVGRWLVVDVGYFNKHTVNGYDFNVLFNTPIVFPVAWDHSRINGFTGRVNLVEHGGFSAFVVLAHTNAIYSPPGVGGVLLNPPAGDFRIDHDQKFNSTTNLQYVFEKRTGAWAAFTWRYDSGLVAGSVPDFATALSLSPDQQAAIGLYCGTTFATLDVPLTDCTLPNRGATRLVIPADGTVDDVKNPPRVAPRHLFDLAVGVDNLLNGARTKLKVRFSVVNLTNKIALYNFLSSFSGTHFVTPRAYSVTFGVTF